MVFKKNLFVVACIAITLLLVTSSFGHPQKKETPQNLLLTFTKDEDVPLAFLEPNSEASTTESKRVIYPACQDGSGGLCVQSGMCPAHLKPETINSAACATAQECCYGVPDSERSCRARGGECFQPAACGRALTIQQTDCSSGKVCCVLT